MSTTANIERRLRDADPTPADLPKSEAAWSSAELLDRIDLQTGVADAPRNPGVVYRPAHRWRGPMIAIGAAFAVLLVLGAVALVSTTSTDAPPATTPTTTIAELEPLPEAEALPPTLEITSVDYEYLGVPEAVRAGTSFDFVNASEDEYHMMWVLRLDSNDERTAQELAALEVTDIIDSEGTERFGSVSVVLGAKPGEPYVNVVDGRQGNHVVDGGTIVWETGRYVILCLNAVAYDVEGAAAAFASGPLPKDEMDASTPHFAVGEFAEFIVED
jgi:hypothetical protein